MTVFFGLVLLVLACAVVLLFAMLGELASRVPTQDQTPSKQVEPIENAKLGAEPLEWPAELAHVPARDASVVLVLSSSCASCEKIAAQVPAALDRGVDLTVVVSCGIRERGEDFAKRHGFHRTHTYIDHGGTWSTQKFGVDSSPAALLFRRGRLQTALLFWDLDSVLAAVGRVDNEIQEVS
ncbi:hypothetical protein AB0J86_15480 [Micromonospora sp. NPDC049559]|uniref:hypothetical protein n=1 Tax=Micromonospora sp. NPDC049559 TaxID=3155923 RepID=UPI0034423FD8